MNPSCWAGASLSRRVCASALRQRPCSSLLPVPGVVDGLEMKGQEQMKNPALRCQPDAGACSAHLFTCVSSEFISRAFCLLREAFSPWGWIHTGTENCELSVAVRGGESCCCFLELQPCRNGGYKIKEAGQGPGWGCAAPGEGGNAARSLARGCHLPERGAVREPASPVPISHRCSPGLLC